MKMKLSDLPPELSTEEQAELEAAEKIPPVFDEDSPAMTAEQLLQFKRMNRDNQNDLQPAHTAYGNGRSKNDLVNLDSKPYSEMTDDEKIDVVASRILKEHRAAFEDLAK